MPAWRLADSETQVTKYDVGGTDGAKAQFICHLLLCDVDALTNVSRHTREMPAVHMGPPLKRSEAVIDVIATADLDSDGIGAGERRQIKAFIDDLFLERRAQEERLALLKQRSHPKAEYTIHPAAREPDAAVPFWRFNCAGFVLRAYSEANIELISEADVPIATLDDLKAAYPWASKRLDDQQFREEMGIGSGDGWPVIMPGYVIHSLSRSAKLVRQSPYAPTAGDKFFPSLDCGDSSSSAAAV